MRHPFALALLGSLAACASTSDTRRLAGSTALYVGSLNEGSASFVEDQNTLNAANAAHLDRLAVYGRPDLADVMRQRLAWKIAGEGSKLAALDAATAVDADAILARFHPSATAPAKVENAAGTNYDAAAAALAKLGQKPAPLDLLQASIDYFEKVREQYNSLADAAAKAAKDAAAKTAQQDTSASTAASANTGG